jgi:7,8-dihydropterin-6-yl-methyl-4-(beta-D-ribofuranosyl)aminobenzene 5'-phosphate synthase
MYRATYLLLFGIFSLYSCQQSSNDKAERKQPKPASEIEDYTITNLYDAFGKIRDGTTKDFGFSALIKYNGKLILFDAGTNADILKNNIEALGIDLKSIDFAICSHAHGDHLNGFDYLLQVNPNVKIYLPFDFYLGAKINFNIEGKEEAIRDSLPEEMQYFERGTNLNITINQSGRFWNANVEYVNENIEIEPGIKLISTRSPYLGYGSKYPSLDTMKVFGNVDSQSSDNEIKFVGLPELSLSLSTEEGEVLVVGCSHSSVQNIIQETKEFTYKEISLLYGGYHMLPYDRNEINTIATQLKDVFGVKKIAPTHCTGHLAFKILKDTYGEDYLFAGLGERIKMKTMSDIDKMN